MKKPKKRESAKRGIAKVSLAGRLLRKPINKPMIETEKGRERVKKWMFEYREQQPFYYYQRVGDTFPIEFVDGKSVRQGEVYDGLYRLSDDFGGLEKLTDDEAKKATKGVDDIYGVFDVYLSDTEIDRIRDEEREKREWDKLNRFQKIIRGPKWAVWEIIAGSILVLSIALNFVTAIKDPQTLQAVLKQVYPILILLIFVGLLALGISKRRG